MGYPDTTKDLLSAAKTCLAAKLYPGREALKLHGARGDWPRMQVELDRLIAGGAVILPDWAAKERDRVAAIKAGKAMARGVPEALQPRPMPMPMPRPRPTAPNDGRPAPPPYDSRYDVKAYRKAWRRIRANRAEVVDMVLMQPVIEEEEEVVDVV